MRDLFANKGNVSIHFITAYQIKMFLKQHIAVLRGQLVLPIKAQKQLEFLVATK